MKIAVFTGDDEIIILPIKGKGKSVANIDGYDKWFGEHMGRDITDYEITMTHIGAGSGICVTTSIKADWLDHTEDIADWFPEHRVLEA